MKEMTLKEIQEQLGYEVEIIAEKEEKSKVWKPKDEEDYWFVDSHGDIKFDYWGSYPFEENLYAIGNCFRTEEEAELYRRKLLVTAELKRFAEEHNGKIDWNDFNQRKYCFCFNSAKKEIVIDYWWIAKMESVYFSSQEIAQRALETIGAERIKKYYLEVQE